MKKKWIQCMVTLPPAFKLLRIMKISLFLICLSFMHLSASVYSQQTKLNFTVKNETIRNVLELIEDQSDYFFLYTNEDVDVNRKVSVHLEDKSIAEVLDNIFDGTAVSYSISDRQIILVKDSNLQNENRFGQIKKVSGNVKDESGQALPGVTVLIKGTTEGTITDFDGNFSIDNVTDGSVIVFSFVGMEAQEIIYSGQTLVNIVMKEESLGIDEVVVVGYGTQSKRDLTGSIASVDTESIKSAPVVNAVQAIQGRASGVSVTQATGQPGSTFVVQIRGVGSLGNTQPLYVIDGIVGAGGSNGINPNDIESIDILKDASAAAIYGSRAANGVVLITTKRGKSGTPKISVDSYVGVQKEWKRLDVLNAKQYAEYSNELQTNGGQPLIPNLQNPSALKDVTDWQDEVFRPAIIQNHNISFSGGNDKGRYLFSAGYYQQDGIIKRTGFERTSFRANSDFNIGKRIKVGESFMISNAITKGADQGIWDFHVLKNTIHMPTYIPVRDPNELGGFDGTDVADGSDPKNPMRMLYLTDREEKNISILGNAYLKFEIIEGLEYKFSASVDYSNTTDYLYTPKYTAGERDVNLYSSLDESFSRGNSILIENTLNYNKIIKKHKFSILAGYTKQWYDGRNFGASVRDFPNTNVRVLSAGNDIQAVTGTAGDWSLVSLLGRLTYSYDGKYLLTANMRRDGSSRFADGNRYGVFPSFSAGWRVSDEEFMESFPIISNLKLKYGWGQLGMQEIGLYPYQATLRNTIRYVMGDSQNPVPAITQLALSNRGISWETTTQSNFGFDLGLMKDAITLSLEYYQRKTEDMLVRVPVPVSSGIYEDPTFNAGAVENKGIDILLGYKNQVNEDLFFSVSGNASYLINNEVTSLGDRVQPLFGTENFQRSIVGESIGHFFGYQVDRIYQQQSEVDADNAVAEQNGWNYYQVEQTAPGDIRFKDLNKDGRITADDRTIIGNPIPKWNYGFNINVEYKNFDFSMMLQGMSGFEIINMDRYLQWEAMQRSFNTTTAVLNRWTPTNPSTTMPRAIAGDPNGNARLSDRWMEDGSYARVKLATIGYQVPASVLNKLGKDKVSSLRVYVSGNNLLTFTDVSVWDPEFTNNTGNAGNNMFRGIAQSIYPQARTIMFGVQAVF